MFDSVRDVERYRTFTQCGDIFFWRPEWVFDAVRDVLICFVNSMADFID